MNMDNEQKDEKEILRELLLTEEDTVKKLKVLIDKTKAIIKIDQKTKKIVFSSDFECTNTEKVLLHLIGKYFCKELSLCENIGSDVKEMEAETGIKKTTLSKPLGGLLYSGYIGQDSEKKYFVNHYKIEDIVNSIYDKYIEKKENAKSILVKLKSSEKSKMKRGGG